MTASRLRDCQARTFDGIGANWHHTDWVRFQADGVKLSKGYERDLSLTDCRLARRDLPPLPRILEPALATVFDGHADGVRACAWSSDGRWVLSASDDKTLRIWDAASGAMVRELTGHTDAVRGLRVVERRALGAVGVWGQDAADLGCRQRRHGPRAHRA